MLLLTAGVTLSVNLGAAQAPAIYFIEWIGALLLIALIVWRFKAGALKSGYQDLAVQPADVHAALEARLAPPVTRGRPLAGMISPTAPLGMTLWIALIVAFLPPPGSRRCRPSRWATAGCSERSCGATCPQVCITWRRARWSASTIGRSGR